MSRTFTSRSVAPRSRGRGSRGRGIQPSIVKTSEPRLLKQEGSSVEETIKASRPVYTSGQKVDSQTSVRGRASKGGMWDPNNSSQPLGGPGYGSNGRRGTTNRHLGQGAGYGRGQFGPQMGYGMPDEELDDRREPAFNPTQASGQPSAGQEDRMTHTGSYTVITPNLKKRQQILTQADRETREYEEHRLRNKPGQFSYVGTAGGGEFTSLEDARQQQMQLHKAQTSKTNRLIREEEKKRQQRAAEEAEFENKKAAARQQAERNKQRLLQTDSSKDQDRRSVNNQFLDRLESQSKLKAATGSLDQGKGDNHAKASESKPGGFGRGEGNRGRASGSWGVAGSRDGRAVPSQHQPATPTAAAATYRGDRPCASKAPSATYLPNAEFSPASQGSWHLRNSTMPASRDPDVVSGNSRRGGYTSGVRGGNGAPGQQFYGGYSGNENSVAKGQNRGDDGVFGDSSVWSGRGGVSAVLGRGDDQSDEHESEGDDDDAQEEDYEEQIAILQTMFPQYKPSLLRDILLQLHGSVEESAALLGE